MNDPFAGGYISQFHYARRGIPRIRIEINRKLYLNETYFDLERLRVDQRIIAKKRCMCLAEVKKPRDFTRLTREDGSLSVPAQYRMESLTLPKNPVISVVVELIPHKR